MPSGRPLSDAEKDKIRTEIKDKFIRQLASEMDLNPLTIRRFLQAEENEKSDLTEKPSR